jgi:protein-S-isoprenylcysteine O-methyltransferase Ste14
MKMPIYLYLLLAAGTGLLATGLIISPLSLLLGAIVVFIAGTLIRIKIEDSLLESQFGAEFVDYRQSVPGMLPFLK